MKAYIILLLVLLGVFEARAQNLKEQCKGIQFDVLPYPDTNDKFIVCVYEVPEVRNCTNSMCFDATLKNCSISACNVTQPSDKIIATQYCNSLESLERIPSVDCTHFWICLGALDPVYATCPKGKHFSRSEQECLSPALAKCMTPEKLCSNNSTVKTFEAENCNEYYACANKNLVKLSCPYGQAYSATIDYCVLDIGNTCVSHSKPDCQDPANVNAYFMHNDCTKFYVCIQSEVYEGKCANGYGYDSQSSSCRAGFCKSS